MYTFSFEERIYAIFDNGRAPDWREQNKFDASPAGLSGKVEGFYFANWLMPFKPQFVYHDVPITSTNFPDCLHACSFDCQFCLFFNIDSCPILQDKSNFELTKKGFDIYQRLVYWPRGDFNDIFTTVQKELLTHGRALHYQILAKMLMNRYPNFRITDKKIKTVLKLNPIFFRDVGEGAYQAMPGLMPSHEHPISILIGDLFVGLRSI